MNLSIPFKNLVGAFLSFTLIAVTPPAASASPDEPDPGDGAPIEELFLAETPDTQEAYELQVTSGFRFRAGPEASAPTVPIVVELGLSNRFQLELEAAFELSKTFEFESVELEAGALYAIVHEGPTRISAGLSTGLAGLGEQPAERTWNVDARFILGRAFSSVHVNVLLGLEVERPLDAGDLELSPLAAVSMFTAIGPIIPAVEAAVRSTDDGIAVTTAAGAAWSINDAVQLGVAVPLQLSPDSVAVGVIASLTFETELINEEDD